MLYTDKILCIEKRISNVLNLLNEKPLFKNNSFEVYKELNFEHWVRISLNKKDSIRIIFELSHGGFCIDIDRADELFDFSYDDVCKDSETIEEILFMIFTSNILVQYCGKHIINFFFIKDKTLKKYIYKNSLFAINCFSTCAEKIYTPIFPEK